MKKILPVAAMLTMVGALASCTSTPAPVSTPIPTTTPVTETPVVTATGAASTGSADTVMTGSTSTGTDMMTGTVSTGTTSTGSTPAVPDMTMTGSAAPTTPAPVSSAVVHTKTVSYSTPAGKDDVEFSVTTADGKVTAVSVTPKATNDVSKMLQGKFKDAIATEVVGKDISKLSLKAVGGASLTTAAFTQYVNSL